MLEQIVFQSLCNFFLMGFFAFTILAMVLRQLNESRFDKLSREHRAKKKEVEARIEKVKEDIDRRTGSIH